MKKVIIAMMFAGITAVSAEAQFKIGIRAGLNAVGVHGDAVPVYDESSSVESKSGFQLGVVGEYSVGEKFVIQPGLLFATQGFLNSMEAENGKLEIDWNLNYLQIPVNATYKFGSRNTKFFLQAGPYLGYALGGKLKGKFKEDGKVTNSDDENIKFGNNEMKRMDFGIGFGLGLQIYAVQLALGYQFGVMNIHNSGELNMKNDCLAFTVSYIFGK